MSGPRVVIVAGAGIVRVDPAWLEALIGRLRDEGIDVRLAGRDQPFDPRTPEIRDADWVVVLCASEEDGTRPIAGLDPDKTIPVVAAQRGRADRRGMRKPLDRAEHDRLLEQALALLRRRLAVPASLGRRELALDPDQDRGQPLSSPPEPGPGPPPPLRGRRRAARGAKAFERSPGGALLEGGALLDAAREDEPTRAEEVHVTTVAPRAVAPGGRFLVEVVFHVEGFEVEAGEDRTVKEGAAVLSLRAGARLAVRLAPVDEEAFAIDDPEAAVVWGPPARRLEFRLRAARELEDGTYDLRAEYWLEGVQLARSYLAIAVARDAPASAGRTATVRRRLPRSAFASYSRRDRVTVAQRVDSLQAVGIDVFLDSLDIRQGEDWREVLERELLGREALLLFWSTAASASEWVEKEWRFALERRGLDAILPNALEPPANCPPPPELATLQFGSVLTELARHWAAPPPAP